MMKCLLGVASAILAVGVVWAAPGKLDPVAPGLPVWQGVTAKNHILGRSICSSDLRHKVTIVLEVEATDQLGEQLSAALPLVGFTQMRQQGSSFGSDDPLLPRDVILVVNCQGLKDRDLVRATFFPKKGAENAVDLKGFTDVQVPVYEDITFVGAPEIPSRPFVYVMGPLRTDPLFAEKFDASVVSEVKSAISRGFAEMDKEQWVPFYGSVSKSKFHAQIAKAIDTQKPLTAVTKAVLAEMVSAKDDLEKQQMQMLYDSLNQTRSEYLHKICLEVESQPLAAFADQQMFVKLWPTHKKDLAEAALKLKAIPGLDKLGALYAKMMVWADPKFKPKNEAAAKKIVAELNNVKKQLSKFKDSKVPQVAAACQVAESKLDELISDIPGRVQGQ